MNSRANELAVSPRLWVAVITPKRGRPWIHYYTIRSTRKESMNAFRKCTGGEPDSRVRFVRCAITELGGAS